MEFKWEKISERGYTYRAKVLGGWIVKDMEYGEGNNEMSVGTSLVFIPDPEHKWEITKN